jgi:protein TonB
MPITPNPIELEELESQLRHALKREAAPPSLAPAVEARMNGGSAVRNFPKATAGTVLRTPPDNIPHAVPSNILHTAPGGRPQIPPHVQPPVAPKFEPRIEIPAQPPTQPHIQPDTRAQVAPDAAPHVTPYVAPAAAHTTAEVWPETAPHETPYVVPVAAHTTAQVAPDTAVHVSAQAQPHTAAQFAPRAAAVAAPYELHLLNPVVDEPVWRTILGNVRGFFAREKLPPLVLTSRPVAVRDPFRVKRSPLSSALSVGTHAVIIALIIFLIIQMRMHPKPVAPKPQVAHVEITPFRPIAVKGPALGGGGGGGAHELVQAPKGKLPKFSETPIAPPMLAVNEHPKLAVAPTIKMPPSVALPNSALPNLGDPRMNIAGPAANGTGSGAGLGSGDGGGIGSGQGAGYGAGEGGGYGGGVYHVGGGVSPPVLIHSVNAEFSDEARRAKFEGVSVVSLIVDAQGMPQRVRVMRKLGQGLDEKAIEAVRQYRFKPSTYQGKPVPVEITVEVNFHLY